MEVASSSSGAEGKSVPASSRVGAEASDAQTGKSVVPPITQFLDLQQRHRQPQHVNDSDIRGEQPSPSSLQQQQRHQHLPPHFTSNHFLRPQSQGICPSPLPSFLQQPHHPQQQQQHHSTSSLFPSSNPSSHSPSHFLNHHCNNNQPQPQHLFPVRQDRLPCYKHSSPCASLMMDDRSGFGPTGGGGGVAGMSIGMGAMIGCNGSVSALNQGPVTGNNITAVPAVSGPYRDWDSRWESGTVVTAATSVRSGGSLDMDLNLMGKQGQQGTSRSGSSEHEAHTSDKLISFHLPFHMYASSVVDIIISVCAFLSPILMLILPKLDSERFRVSDVCGPELTTCDGILISFFFKILLLVLASVLLFFRSPRAHLPRVFLSRAIVLGLVLLLTVAYWLFFLVQSSERRVADYDLPFRDLLLSYPIPLLECLLWVHYLAVILIEIRHQRQQYYVRVVRSPDGHSRNYTIGQLSIQGTAVFVLDKYYSQFPVYNPHLDALPFSSASSSSRKKGKMTGSTIEDHTSGLKFYDIDAVHPGMHTNTSTPNNNSHNSATSAHIGNGHLPDGNNSHGHHHHNHQLAGNSHSPLTGRAVAAGMLSGGGSNFHVSPLNGGSNSIYSIRSVAATGNHNNTSSSPRITSGKSHSVVGVERSSDRHHHHHSHHHNSRKGGSSSRSSHGGGNRSSDRNGGHGLKGGPSAPSDDRHNRDRLHEELEIERRVKKRRTRLLSAAEEAFTHVRLMGEADQSNGAAISMDPMETAQAIFPSMSRPLQKYLRVTRQTGRHTLHSILSHLSTAMKYGMSAKSFLEKYLVHEPVLNDESEERRRMQTWGLVSDVLLSRSIRPGTTFMLRQGDVSLLVTISGLPCYDLQEEVIDPKSNRFVFRMNSETSV